MRGSRIFIGGGGGIIVFARGGREWGGGRDFGHVSSFNNYKF